MFKKALSEYLKNGKLSPCPRCMSFDIKTFDYFGEYQTICMRCFEAGLGYNNSIHEAENVWNKTWLERFQKFHPIMFKSRNSKNAKTE